MRTVQDIAKEIVAREGGFVNDPDDPGGPTNFGVTLGTLQRLGLDVDRDGKIDIDDVRTLQPAHAEVIFVEHYFERTGIRALPAVLQASVFDMYVNAGRAAVRILQQLLVEMGHPIVVDGAIGPQTVEAAEVAAALAPQYLADAYGIARRNFYLRLADARPASRKFARSRSGEKGGWVRRAEEFISPRYHMTEAEFQSRVAAWD
ncbi:MAG: peptidoglycan-binding protein [Rhodobacteraceae bacterium]|nr:peptidoglycan-binding protein [Paracoccaceae bacterium]